MWGDVLLLSFAEAGRCRCNVRFVLLCLYALQVWGAVREGMGTACLREAGHGTLFGAWVSAGVGWGS